MYSAERILIGWTVLSGLFSLTEATYLMKRYPRPRWVYWVMLPLYMPGGLVFVRFELGRAGDFGDVFENHRDLQTRPGGRRRVRQVGRRGEEPAEQRK